MGTAYFDFDREAYVGDDGQQPCHIPETEPVDMPSDEDVLGMFTSYTEEGMCLLHGSPIIFGEIDRPLWLTDSAEVANTYGEFIANVAMTRPVRTLNLVEALSRAGNANTDARMVDDRCFHRLIEMLHEGYDEHDIHERKEKFSKVGMSDSHWGVIDIHDERVRDNIARMGFDAVYIEDTPEMGNATQLCNAYFVMDYRSLRVVGWSCDGALTFDRA